MKKILAILLALVMAASLCACGSSSVESPAYYTTAEEAYEPEYAYSDYAAAEAYGLANSGATYVKSASDESAASDSDTGDTDPEKLIYSADVTVETREYDTTIEKLNAMLEEYGAYVQSSSVNSATYNGISSGNPGTRSASYVIRVPAEKFSTMMSSLTALGNVPYSYTYTENVTSQYYDTQARMNNYKAQEERLNELLDKAETVSDIIEIENQLTEVRYQIESLQSTLNNWDRRVSRSTINLSIEEVGEYTPVTEESFGTKLARAFKNGFDGFKDVLLAIAELLPTIVFLGVVVIGIIHVIRRIKKNRKARKEKAAAVKEESKEQQDS